MFNFQAFLITIFGFLLGAFSRLILKFYPERNLRVNLKLPVFELLNAFIYFFVYIKYGWNFETLVFALLCSLVIWIAVIDIYHYVIPNEAVLLGLSIGIVYYIVQIISGSNNYWSPIVSMFAGPMFYIFTYIISFAITKQEGIGGGDIKLMAPIGLILGLKLNILVIIISIIIAGIISSILFFTKIKNRHDVIPFGPFISLATVITILYGQNIISWYSTNFL